ncbi:T9SS-dependent M36 family metallopeptidase [Chryseobacterium sp. T1]
MKNKLLTRSLGIGALFFVSVLSAQDTETIIRDYIAKEASFKEASNNLDFKILNENNSQSLKSNIVDIQQYYNGLPIYKALGKVVIQSGKVLTLQNNFEKKTYASDYKNKHSVLGAFRSMMDNLGLASESYQLVDASDAKETQGIKNVFNETYYAFNENDKLVPAQLFFVDDSANNAFWSVLVNLENNQIIEKYNMVISCSFDHDHAGDFTDGNIADFNNSSLSELKVKALGFSKAEVGDASYNVFKLPIEAPTFGAREIVSNPWDLSASPLGWHSTTNKNYTNTQGNNVHAYFDNVGNNSSNPADDVDGGANRIFDFPYTQGLTVSAYDNKQSSITNLFYMNNMMHDIFYKFGFTESARNYQVDNFGKGGLGNDPVKAEAFDGSGYNNANFNPGRDGFSTGSRMQMYLWNVGQVGVKQKLYYNSPQDAVTRPGVNAGRAVFGKQVLAVPITGDVVVASDITGCSKITNDLKGKIGLVSHVNTCNYITKVKNLQDAGATGVIIYRTDVGTPVDMGDASQGTSGVLIPSIMIGKSEGDYLLDQVKNGVVVNVSLKDLAYGYRNSSFDNAVIAHEYGHGISNRMTGQGFGCLSNQEQMGEGWSDFFGLMVTNRPGFTSTTARGMGTYSNGQGTTGQGIRTYRYTTDMSANPFTYASTNSTGGQAHAVGQIWATMLWDLHWKMAEKYGYNYDVTADPNSGSAKALQLVMDGLKLQPCNPDFVSGRNAILQADALKGGVDECLIWEVFAKRGLGLTASSGSPSNISDQVENFDLPEKCKLAINEVSKDKAYNVYPNPAKGEFFIKGKPTLSLDKVKVEILDVSGKLVKSFERNKNAIDAISTRGMAKGVYIISITEGGKPIQADKLIVE